MTTTIAERNRAIKRALEQAFGRGKVAVRGSRGTAYGWVRVRINYAPRNLAEAQKLYSMAQQLACLAAKESGHPIGSYCSDDGYNTDHPTINIDFDPRCHSDDEVCS